jgi:hypothetical protein
VRGRAWLAAFPLLVTDAAELDTVCRGLAAKYPRALPADPAALSETWISRMDPR